MAQEMNAAETAVYRQLQKSYRAIQKKHDQWLRTQVSTLTTIKLLDNLIKQHCVCLQVDCAKTPLQSFPDVQLRLLSRIASDMERHIAEIKKALCCLEELRDESSRQRQHCLRLYERYWQHLGIPEVCSGTPTWPSISQLLERLHHIDTTCHTQFASLEYHLDCINYEDENCVERLLNSWNSDLEQLKETLALVFYLLQEKL